MRFKFDKLGFVDQGELELGDLTVLCGPNNVGKTYVTYAIYGLLKHFKQWVDFALPNELLLFLKEQGTITIDLRIYQDELSEHLTAASQQFAKKISHYFKTPEEFFEGTRFDFGYEDLKLNFQQEFSRTLKFGKTEILMFDKGPEESRLSISLQTDGESQIPSRILDDVISDRIVECLFENIFPKPFVLTSERTGISLFYKELDLSKNAILEHISETDKVDPFELLNSMRSRYAQPIQDNINVIRDYDNLIKQKSFIREDKETFQAVLSALQDLMGGSFKAVNKQVTYVPKKERGRDKVQVPVYIASSSIKSLFLMDLYVNNLAEKNGLLIIDEPELNLHPDNQRKMAALLARLVNAGVKVLVTTHSDYLIREINNRVMLSGEVDDKASIMKRAGMVEQDLLKPEQLRAYALKSDHKIHTVEVDQYGINMKIFDDLIAESNDLSDQIYFGVHS